ncbi:hypothetical protein COU95_01115 [Candidatus Shapirobacteria bacterium CG10_big_fil_rev_8_21_14_0_10_40_9]|uniref:Uncharacterized protein n=1 Tax=Candidatus Shapirobacteria bacterium CG10_big_fil_rev_8_21_14_0_10_40_9 TaxID=1974888 RepID=A0A2M8L413_9BACT|nr:MAG: hypothetical protein COU95_01115 [Candidatus Shapirobacteria bacterium CG10_big_fil_rev_8_21_14_0_10_40_9]
MPEEIEANPEETIKEQPKAGLLEKLRIHKGKILGGVLGIFVFAGAVFGAYKFGQRQVQPGPWPTPTPKAVATPTPDETANWKTYTNTKYGYSIKYPPDFEIKEAEIANTPLIGGVSILDPKARDEKIAPKYRLLFGISLYRTENEAIEEIYKEPLSQYLGQKEFANIGTIAWVELDGKRAVRTTGSSTGGFFDRVEAINKEIKFNIEETAFTEEEREANKQTLNLMLSTFRFLE